MAGVRQPFTTPEIQGTKDRADQDMEFHNEEGADKDASERGVGGAVREAVAEYDIDRNSSQP